MKKYILIVAFIVALFAVGIASSIPTQAETMHKHHTHHVVHHKTHHTEKHVTHHGKKHSAPVASRTPTIHASSTPSVTPTVSASSTPSVTPTPTTVHHRGTTKQTGGGLSYTDSYPGKVCTATDTIYNYPAGVGHLTHHHNGTCTLHLPMK